MIDSETGLGAEGVIKMVPALEINTMDVSYRVTTLLNKFPGITVLTTVRKSKIKHNTKHVLDTLSKPIRCRARSIILRD